MTVVPIVSAVSSSEWSRTSFRMTALRCVAGSETNRASAARTTAGSGLSSNPASSSIGMDLGETSAMALQEIERGIVCDAKEPRPKRRHVRRETQGVESLGERLLDDVLALDDGAGETRAITMELGPHACDEGEELLTCIGKGFLDHGGERPSAARFRSLA